MLAVIIGERNPSVKVYGTINFLKGLGLARFDHWRML